MVHNLLRGGYKDNIYQILTAVEGDTLRYQVWGDIPSPKTWYLGVSPETKQSMFGLLHPFIQIYDLISDVIYLQLGK